MKKALKTGRYAFFKVEDYGIARFILDDLQYKTEMLTLEGWMELFGKQIPLNITDHSILVVSRP